MRMLCSRSASLMRTTRMSSAIASSIFRMFSACCCSWLWVQKRDSFVTPSTRCATSAPKLSSMSVRLYSVSSGTSWSSAASTAIGSMPRSATIWADAIGWVTYGSPVARGWPLCASTARSNARSTPDRSAVGWWSVIVALSAERSASRSISPGPPGRTAGVRRGPRRAGVLGAFLAGAAGAPDAADAAWRAGAAARSALAAGVADAVVEDFVRGVAMGRKDSSEARSLRPARLRNQRDPSRGAVPRRPRARPTAVPRRGR